MLKWGTYFPTQHSVYLSNGISFVRGKGDRQIQTQHIFPQNRTFKDFKN